MRTRHFTSDLLIAPVIILAAYVYVVVSTGLLPTSAPGVWLLGAVGALCLLEFIEVSSNSIIDRNIKGLLAMFWPLPLVVVAAKAAKQRLAGRRG